MRTKLDYIEPELQRNKKDDIIDRRDAVYKQKMKQQREYSAARRLCTYEATKAEQVEYTL